MVEIDLVEREMIGIGDLKIDVSGVGLSEEELKPIRGEAASHWRRIAGGHLEMTGWMNLPQTMDEDALIQIEKYANQIKEQSDCLVVLGVGGSYMGAKAAIDLLASEKNAATVIFAGHDFSSRHLTEIFRQIDGKEYSLCVISKSGSTAETMVAYGIFKDRMIQKYGSEETARRTYVITGATENPLRSDAEKCGSHILNIPEDVGGRYSVLTAVGLLPMAVANIDIYALMRGARIAAETLSKEGNDPEKETVFDYAIARNLLFRRGKIIEVFEFFESHFTYLGEWIKQLFGESEGKDGKGIFPTSLLFSRDLHSMGQFLQEGNPCFFETMIAVEDDHNILMIPMGTMDPYGGKSLKDVNKAVKAGTRDAHLRAGVPVIDVTLPFLEADVVGQLLFFFQAQCAVSALLMGVDPFNQPGVEQYKKSMKEMLQNNSVL